MVASNQIPATTSTIKKPSITAFSMLRLPWFSGGSGSALPPSVICRSWFRRIEMNLAAIVDDTIARFPGLFTFPGKRICVRQIIRTDRRLAVTAGNVDDVIRLAQSGDPSPQGTHQFLPMLERGTQVRRAGREVAVMQVIGFYAAFDERPHQRFQHRGVVIDAPQQHRLAYHRNAGVDDIGACGAGLVGQFPGMVGVQRNPGGRALDGWISDLALLALVDEATGFQATRDREALQEMLDRFLRHELAAWAKRFPDQFYEHIFRLRGWK